MCGRAKMGPGSVSYTKSWVGHDGDLPGNLPQTLPGVMNNFSPSNAAPIVIHKDGGMRLVEGVWGLVPSWSKEKDHWKMFNARSETAAEKSSFRGLVNTKRAIFVLEGYFEWRRQGTSKTPFYITTEKPLLVACLYDYSSTFKVTTFTLLTMVPPSTISAIHDRCPVVLSDETLAQQWLSGSLSLQAAVAGKSPLASPSVVKFWNVHSQMGKATYQGEDASAPATKVTASSSSSPPPSKKQAGIASFFLPSSSKKTPSSSPPPPASTRGPVAVSSSSSSSKNDVVDLTGEDEDEEDDEEEAVVGQKRERE